VRFGRVFVLLIAALFLCASAPALAAPALWLVQGPVGKVYLFGTVHLLRDGVQWRSPELEAAMQQSQDLYLEIANPTDQGLAATSLLKLGYDRAHPLSTKLSKSDLVQLQTVMSRDGLGDESRFENMQPWLVAVTLQVRPMVHSGYVASNGTDLQVRKEFLDAGKPVDGLETIDTQIHIYADMSQADQVVMLEDELKARPQFGVSQLDSVIGVWLTGDQDRLASALQFDKLPDSPANQRMLLDRNTHWAN
jgi:uncharacterized protein